MVMLTSYRMSCPHGCGWSGSLLPQTDTNLFRGALPNVKLIAFQCPQCESQWAARVVGDDIINLPVEKKAVTRS
jgi:hypothetical protein